MRGLPFALSSLVLAAAVGVTAPAQVFGAPARSTYPAAMPAAPTTPTAVTPTKVLLIVEENETAVAARKGMPVLARLGKRYGRTTHYRALAHPSLPNYLALAGGSTFGVRDDLSPSAHHIAGRSVFDQAIAAHRSATAYAESMPSRCERTSSGLYAARHNPWTYFHDATSRVNCRHHDVPAGTVSSGALHDDVVNGRLPAVGMLTPNLCHDAHNCSLATANRWLKAWLQVIRSGPDWTSGRLAVVVTFDEDDGAHPNSVLTTVLAPSIRDVASAAHLTHYSWTRYADELIGAPPLRQARHARSLRSAFGL
jgi:phosphatidylinositol-3-phosphatase